MNHTFDIDETLLQKTMQLSNLDQNQTIELALQTFIQYQSCQKLRESRGKLHWEGDLTEMRQHFD